jgi:uncharacterized repeat protein (TIGR04138 family)
VGLAPERWPGKNQATTMEDKLRRIALDDGRYSPEAYAFLLEGLEQAIALAGKATAEGPARHVTGREVLEGLEALAKKQFGPLTGEVWRSWGVRAPVDWGHVVFALVEAGLLSRQDSDTLADFDIAGEFGGRFAEAYKVRLPRSL